MRHPGHERQQGQAQDGKGGGCVPGEQRIRQPEHAEEPKAGRPQHAAMLGEDLERTPSPADSLPSQLGVGSRHLGVGDCPRLVRNSAAACDDLKSQVEILG